MFKAIMKRLRKDQRGLTLIELLVVIVILGIIAAIAIPMIMGNTERANQATAETTNKVVSDAADRYSTLNNGAAPEDITVLVGEYLSSTPTCPSGWKVGTTLTAYCVTE